MPEMREIKEFVAAKIFVSLKLIKHSTCTCTCEHVHVHKKKCFNLPRVKDKLQCRFHYLSSVRCLKDKINC